MKTLQDLSQALEKIIKHYYGYHYRYDPNQTAESAETDDFELINITHSLETCIEHLSEIKQKRASLLAYLYYGIKLITRHITTTKVLEEQKKQLLQQQLVQFIMNLQNLLNIYETECVIINEETETFQIVGLVNALCSGSGISRSGQLIRALLLNPLFPDSFAASDDKAWVVNLVIENMVNDHHITCLFSKISAQETNIADLKQTVELQETNIAELKQTAELQETNMTKLKQQLTAPKLPLSGHLSRQRYSMGLFGHLSLTIGEGTQDLPSSLEDKKKEAVTDNDDKTLTYLFNP